MVLRKMVICAALLVPHVGLANDTDDNERILPLVGLRGVRVLIEDLNEHAKAGGLDRGDLRKQVVERLQCAGLRLLTDEEFIDAPGNPILSLTVTAAAVETKMLETTVGYACWVELELSEIVYLERHLADERPQRAYGTVWEAVQGSMNDKNGLPASVKQSIRKTIDDLCHDLQLARKLEESLPKSTDARESGD